MKFTKLFMPINVLKRSFAWRMLGLLLVSLFRLSAAAQTTTATLPPMHFLADSIRQAAREDTTYALQRLFHENRRRYRVYAILSGVGLGFSGTRAALEYYRQSGFTQAKLSTGIVTIGFAVFFTRSIILFYRFRASREKKLISAMQQGMPLPYKVRRKIKPGYFDTQTNSK